MQAFSLIAYTPPGPPEPSIAIAASRAGYLGVLNLEYTRNRQAASDAIKEVALYAKNDFGIKLDSRASEFSAELMQDTPEQLTTVILTSCDSQTLYNQVQSIQGQELIVLLEATYLEQAQMGEELGVDGVIAKGYEAGGRIGEETTLVLLQRLLTCLKLPVWAHGGVGLHTTPACYIAGAAGVVLDTQLALCRESSLPESVKARIAIMDGSETVCLGDELGETYRVYSRPRIHAIEKLRQKINSLAHDKRPQREIIDSWRQTILGQVGWNSTEQNLLLLGQDAAFAAPLAKRFGTVGRVLEGLKKAIYSHCQSARKLRPLDEESPLAQSHGTRYPIVQGPMARISDIPAFALAVAESGGLPFLALSVMETSELKCLLEKTKRTLGNRSWGVGIIGFLPPDLWQQQINVIRDFHPPYALIAGGRPKQNRPLEEAGIPTYMHIPSPALLKLFLNNGDHRFILEGRESGGHVGPLCSFVLWETVIDEFLQYLSPDKDASQYHVLFAGGIHDALSASMVGVMAAPLVERGVRVGIQMGTAYLFTEELVRSGGVVNNYQQEALKCDQTVVLEVGTGYANRCAHTPFAKAFGEKKRRLEGEGKSVEEMRLELEQMCLGRLHMASKGTSINDTEVLLTPETSTLGDEEQRTKGMYMIGEVGVIRNEVCTLEALHHDIAVQGSRRLESLTKKYQETISPMEKQAPSDIAIVGMACIMPKATDLQSYWENIITKIDAITEVPKERWDWKLYYDQNPKARDKVYSKWGGFLDTIPFDPVEYGMPPRTLYSIEPTQLLILEVVKKSLIDAGYYRREFNRERTSVILGLGGGGGDLAQKYLIRSTLPTLLEEGSAEPLSHLGDHLPEWTEDSFPGILMNVAAGRVSNRFGLQGVNYVVDAACASSLAAVHLAVRELETHSSDIVIVGGADTMQSPFAYLCFSKTLALSPTRQARTFDETADGIVLGEGVGILILKRLADAERDGDKIYALIKGVGSSSDGRAKGITAPRLEGQVLALKRAYQKANISPATVGLIEAHGTGTTVGDRVEIQALSQVFSDAYTSRQNCAIGSVKSMIGHTKNTAGVASLIKAAMALDRKVLPPTLGVSKPNAAVNSSESPFYINTDTRPWINGASEEPRRAGVSAFGFGGTNFHAVLEEYRDDCLGKETGREAVFQQWPSELFFFSGDSPQEILLTLESVERALFQGAKPKLQDLSYTLSTLDKQKTGIKGHAKSDSPLRLAIVATSLDDLTKKLAKARHALVSSRTNDSSTRFEINDPRGIYFTEQPLGGEGKIAFLFPGQGSQYINMLKEPAVQFPEVRRCFERANQTLKGQLSNPLSSYIFPPPTFTEDEESALEKALAQTNVAQPAVGAADLAMFHLLKELGIRPDFVAGHSYGEYVALCVAGVFSEDVLITLSEARGRFIVGAAGNDMGAMAAVDAGAQPISEILMRIKGVTIANLNSPEQTVISGPSSSLQEAIEKCKAQGISARLIPVACAFHSPVIAPARELLVQFLANVEVTTPHLEVFSNTTASPYPREPKAIVNLLAEHLVSPVKFVDEIEALYKAGARVFLEVGPHSILTSLTSQILKEKSCLITSSDRTGRHGLLQLHHLLGQLAVHDVPVRLGTLYRGRTVRKLDLNALEKETDQEKLPPTAWLVNGGRAVPFSPDPASGSDHVASPTHFSSPLIPPQEQLSKTLTSPRYHKDSESGPPPAESSGRGREPSCVSLPEDGHERIMAQFQKMMNRFLDTQKSVMEAYLKTRPDGQGKHDLTRDSATDAPATGKEINPVLSASPRKADVLSNREELTSCLLQIVSNRTGYPIEMLSLDSDLEADLGIDSIKRVEILGSLGEKYAWQDEQDTDQFMEKLAGLKTLGEIIGWVENRLKSLRKERETEPEGEDAILRSPTSQAPLQELPEDDTVERFTLSAVDMPIRGKPTSLTSGSVFVLTDDEEGVAQALAGKVRSLGHPVALVRTGDDFSFQTSDIDFYTANLTSPTAVDQLLNAIRQQQGPIGGIVHLLPLKRGMSFEEMDSKGWKERLTLEVKSLFYLAKGVGEEIRQAAKDGGACLVAAASMGGTFASVPQSTLDTTARQWFPGQGGVTGLVKTIAAEWPEVRVKIVDLSTQEAPSTTASKLLQEITTADGQVEVGFPDSHRLILQPVHATLDKGRTPAMEMDASWVILVTGGAQGITADVACELAKHYQPILLLVGRSPLPEAKEAEETAKLEGRELKAVLMARMRREGHAVTPARVEEAYRRVLKDREMRNSITVMRSYGAKIHYYQADVQKENEFGNLINEIYQSYGRLDGVIHGAGIIEDKLINDKTPDSFDRVFDTKVDSAFILSRTLRPDCLKFLVFFSSVAGRFGNRGQCDYSAANEVYNKLALYLDSRWPGRVVSIIWGPWARTGGMVSQELQNQFSKSGIVLVPGSVGPQKLDEELRYGRKGEVEVLIGGNVPEISGEGTGKLFEQEGTGEPFSLIGKRVSLSKGNANGVEVLRTLDPAHDLYLKDHQLDGKPVLPMAMALELMAEVVAQGWQEFELTAVKEMHVLRGIILENGPKPIRVAAKPLAGSLAEQLEVEVSILGTENYGQVHYRATAELAKRIPAPIEFKPRSMVEARPFPMSVQEAYRQLLFHGPQFQRIDHIEKIGTSGIAASIVSSAPRQCVASTAQRKWLIDPMIIDNGLQLILIWARVHWDTTPLPSRFLRYRRFASSFASKVDCHVYIRPNSNNHIIHADLAFFHPEGHLMGLLEDIEAVCSRSLNLFTGSHVQYKGV